ncbi:MAG: nitroreductase family protein [Chloroflexi bacterium]|nr:nitroreductase family protein [Chloroflexota bacterium]
MRTENIEKLDISLGDAIYSLRAIRRLKEDAISDDDLSTILDAARQAPNGGNQQPWHFLVIRDAGLRQKFGVLYREAWWAKRNDGGYFKPEDLPDHYKSAMGLAESIGTASVIVLVCTTDSGARESVIPATQNLLLAARGLGIGGTITTLHSSVAERARKLLAIPDGVEIVYNVPLGYPKGRFGPVRRKPLQEVVSENAWGRTPPWACC